MTVVVPRSVLIATQSRHHSGVYHFPLSLPQSLPPRLHKSAFVVVEAHAHIPLMQLIIHQQEKQADVGEKR